MLSKLISIFKDFKKQLLFIYAFMFIVELSNIFKPFLLGKAVDGLISFSSYTWIIILCASFIISSLFNYKRMVYDTMVYTSIYNSIVLKYLFSSDDSSSVKIARTDMAGDVVDVMEGYVHYYIAVIISIIGSLSFILFASVYVFFVCLISFFFILFCVLFFYTKIRQSIHIKNNHHEKKADALSSSFPFMQSFFARKRRIDIYASTLQGKSWLLVSLVKYFFLVLCLIVLIKTSPSLTIGSVISIYAYIDTFLISLMSIPVGIEMYSRISNIISRL
jgi:hypothetical protein